MVFHQFEISLGMLAIRAVLQSAGPFVDMPASAAPPARWFRAGKVAAVLQFVEQFQIPFLVGLFDLADRFENEGNVRETLIPRLPGHARIHVGALVVLA